MMSNKNKNKQSGNSLLELMFSVTILGILMGVALPAYKGYAIRAHLTEGYGVLNKLKTDVELYLASTGDINALKRGRTRQILRRIGANSVQSTALVNSVWIGPWAGNDITLWFLTKNESNIPSEIRFKWPFALAARQNSDGTLSWSCINYSYSRFGVNRKYLPKECI